MRIISPFHDYYDSAMGLGVDWSLVFVRPPGELSEAEGKRFAIEPGPDYQWYAKDWTILASARPFWVAVAGRRFKGMEVRFRDTFCGRPASYLAARGPHAYGKDGLIAILASNGMGLPDVGRRKTWETSKARKLHADLDAWFSAADSDVSGSMAESGLSVLAQRDKAGPAYRSWNNRMNLRPEDWAPIEVNPRLLSFEFYRAMQPFELYQELSMWVGGVLPQHDAMTARFSDADRFVERGFDAKTSFRKMSCA